MEQMCVCDCVCLEYIYFKINYKLSNIFNGMIFCGKFKKSYLRNAWEIAILLHFFSNIPAIALDCFKNYSE